ncbi:MAG: IS4 family transposase [Chloroflexota bacterium]
MWQKGGMTQETKQEQKRLVDNIETFLQKVMEAAEAVEEPRRARYPGRKRILPAMVLWSGVVVAVLRGLKSQRSIWRLVGLEGLWDYPAYEVTDQAVYNRLAAGDNGGLKQVFKQVRDGLRERLLPYAQEKIAPFATGVYAIDGSTLDKVTRHLPKLRGIPNGDSRLLPGKLVGLFNIRLQQWEEVTHLTNPNQNDKTVARELAQILPKGSLILADMGFFSFAWFDWLTDHHYWWLSRVREKTTYEVIHPFYKDGSDLFDGLIWLGKYRSDKAAHAVRLVTFTVGKTHFRYITNVLDPNRLSLHDIAVLYARRWDIELAFKMVKRHLKLHLLWSAKETIILQQVWAVLILSQILHALQMEIAGLAQVDPFDVSLDLLTQYVPRLTQQGHDPVALLVVKGEKFGFIRPSRRIRPKTPAAPLSKYASLPPETSLRRKPRYAQRRCKPKIEAETHNKASPPQGVLWFPYR